MTKIVHKTKIVAVPEKGQEIFKQLSTQYKSQLLWFWAVDNNSWLDSFMSNTLINFSPPKAVNREVQAFWVPHNGGIAIQLEWKEPTK